MLASALNLQLGWGAQWKWVQYLSLDAFVDDYAALPYDPFGQS
jgi:hypothetical protein